MKITNTLTKYISAMLLATACVTTGNGFAADNDPVGLTPTPEDAAGIAKQPNCSSFGWCPIHDRIFLALNRLS